MGGILNKWVKVYGKRGDVPVDFANSVAIDTNGEIIVAGSTGSFGGGGLDFWVLRLDENGDIVWQKAYGGDEDEDACKVAVDSERNIVVAGLEGFPFVKKRDILVLKLDKDGDIVWQKACRGKNNNVVNCIAVNDKGDIVVAGSTETFGAGRSDALVLKLDEDGDMVWQKAYGGKGVDEVYGVAIGKRGEIIVAGSTGSFGGGGLDFWVLRLDENGDIVWQKEYGGKNNDRAYGVAVDRKGDIVVVGSTTSFGAGGDDAWILKLDEDGDIVWQKAYGGKKNDRAYGVAVDDEGNIVVAGSTETFGAGKDDVWVLKLDEDGNVLWQNAYGGKGNEWAEDVAVDDDGNIVVVGNTDTFARGGYSAALVLYLGSDGKVYSSTPSFRLTSTNAFPIATKASSSFTPAKVKDAYLELLKTWKEVTDTKAAVNVLARPQ